MKYIEVDNPSPQIPKGTKIKIRGYGSKFTIKASNAFLIIATRGKGYTIIDRRENIMGRENLIFSIGAETDEQCEEMLQRLTSGETEISQRYRQPFEAEKYYIPAV